MPSQSSQNSKTLGRFFERLYKVTGVGSTDVESGVGVGAMESAVEASGLVEGDGVGMGEWQQKGHVIIIEDNSLK